MPERLKAVVLAVALTSCLGGCAPKEMFSWIDRNCFVADWTNHHSCLSCCRNGGCQQCGPMVEYEMLVLGDQAVAAPETAAEEPIQPVVATPALEGATGDER